MEIRVTIFGKNSEKLKVAYITVKDGVTMSKLIAKEVFYKTLKIFITNVDMEMYEEFANNDSVMEFCHEGVYWRSENGIVDNWVPVGMDN